MTEPIHTAFQRAVAAHQKDDFEEAERQYRRVLDLSEGAATSSETYRLRMQAHFNLGHLALNVFQPAVAIPHLKALCEGDTAEPGAWTLYAAALNALGRPRDALATLERAAAKGVSPPNREELITTAQRRTDAIKTYGADLIKMLQPFTPMSSGAPEDCAELTIAGANRVLARLAELATGDRSATASGIQRIDSFCTDGASLTAANTLTVLFNRYGSDKAKPTTHNYQHLYGWILRDPENVSGLLEIGLGTNNIDVVSNMSRKGRPGASLRAFRDFLPKAKIYGADVDKRILFSEERIETFHVDQTDPETFDRLAEVVPDDLDLIIDDGLHSPDANLTTLLFALKKIRLGGWFVVEDIGAASLPIWKVVSRLLPANFAARILREHTAYVFAVQRLRGPADIAAA